MIFKQIHWWTLSLLLLCAACGQSDPTPATSTGDWHFSALPAEQTGIQFRNDVPYTDSFNCYLFRNFYNGGGVGLGDVNNDGLLDVFLCGNLSPNRLYLNLGNWQFKDVTEACGMGLSKTWTAGVALADVNGDGWLDIYTCKSGPPGGPDRHNELFVNQGVGPNGQWSGQFTEQSKTWGLDNTGLSTHAAFFDYDRDGDLDCYLLNNSLRSVGGYDYRPGQRNTPDPEGGNKLLRNDGAPAPPSPPNGGEQTSLPAGTAAPLGRKALLPPAGGAGGGFTDVSAQAGIYTSAIGFGLGVAVGDYDRDGWQDLFISNDFFERDYLYHNRGNGTFEEVLVEKMPEISKGSMGADVADLNNDGFPEVFVTEMTPPDEQRYKTKAIFDDWNTYSLMQQTGYHRQFGRNVLQLNNEGKNFSEIGRFAGVHFTDWSWGALLADFDNDGWKDIFVANGIGKDLLDQDYANFYADPAAIQKILQDHPGQGIKTLIDQMPSQPVANCLFRQNNPLDSVQRPQNGSLSLGVVVPKFTNVAAAVGLGEPSFSNGSAYGDLDNDGDLDLVVNNVNAACSVFRNDAPKQHNWLKIKLEGEGGNTGGFGAKVSVRRTWLAQELYQEVAPMRGFESCVDPRPNFGVGTDTVVSVRVEFLSGKVFHQWVKTNQILTVREADAVLPTADGKPVPPPRLPVFAERQQIAVPAQATAFSDFDREPLLFRMFSDEGPKLAVGDANGDGWPDLYVGGAAGVAGQLLLQTPTGAFKPSQQPDFQQDRASEDSAATFFDADGDGDLDLYVGSGSNEFKPGEAALQDRLYLNDGQAHFRRATDAMPTGKPFATACARAADVDGDGDLDIFAGMRLVPGHYGQSPQSFLLLNDGRGHFQPVVQQYPALAQLGMVTDAQWADVDGDRDPDLVVVGEWEPVRLLLNEGGQLKLSATFPAANGWWNCLNVSDLNGDGRPDLVVGNHGLNARFKASPQQPLSLWLGDFDHNDRDESILCQYNGAQSYPLVLRNDLVKQLPMLKKKYLQYANYAGQTVEQIFTPEQLKGATQRTATTLATSVFWNRGNGQFDLEVLPDWAQISPVYAIAAADFTGDGLADLLLGGNHERCKPESGQYLASRGVLLAGDGRGHFSYWPQARSGLNWTGSVRDLAVLGSKAGPRVAVSRVEEGVLVLGW